MINFGKMINSSTQGSRTIPSHFRIPSSGHLEPIFTRTILNVGFATSAVVLPQIDSIWPKSGREFLEVIISRALRHNLKRGQMYFSLCSPRIPIDERKARTILEDLCAWDVVVNDEQSMLAAIDLKAQYQLFF